MPDDDAQTVQTMTGYLTGLVHQAIESDSNPLTKPVVVEPTRPGVVQVRLASGMLARITVEVQPDFRGGWYHQGHFHPPGDEPHVHDRL